MKTKILMLVGIAVSVMFLSTSAFADLTLTTEQIDRDNYVEVVIKAQNDGSDDYPQVGIHNIRMEMEGEPVVCISTIEGYSPLGNPIYIENVQRILNPDGSIVCENAAEIVLEDPEYVEGLRVITGSMVRRIWTPAEEGERWRDEMVGRTDFINEYNSNGVKIRWKEWQWRPDPESETEFTLASIQESWLLGIGGPWYIPSDPLYSLHAVPGGSEVDLGSVYVQKPIGDETYPVHVYGIGVISPGGGIVATLDFVVDPNVE